MRVAFALLILLILAATAFGTSIGHAVAIVAFTLIGALAGSLVVVMIQREWESILIALNVPVE